MEQPQILPIPEIQQQKFHGYSYLDQKYVEEYNNFGVPTEFSQLNDGTRFIVPVSYSVKMLPLLLLPYLILFSKKYDEAVAHPSISVEDVKLLPTKTQTLQAFEMSIMKGIGKSISDDICKTISSEFVANYYKQLAIKNSGGVVSPSIREYMNTVTKDNSEKNLNLEKLWAEYQTTCFKDPKRALQMYNLFNATNMDMNEANPMILEVALNNPGFPFNNSEPLSTNASKYYDWLHTKYYQNYNTEESIKKFNDNLSSLNNFQARNLDPFNTIASTVVAIPDPGIPIVKPANTGKSIYLTDTQINNYVV